jgi:hypothetical protein
MTHEAIAQIEEELAKDRAVLEQAIQRRESLSAARTHSDFRVAAIGISLRFDIQRLTRNISKKRYRLVNGRL